MLICVMLDFWSRYEHHISFMQAETTRFQCCIQVADDCARKHGGQVKGTTLCAQLVMP